MKKICTIMLFFALDKINCCRVVLGAYGTASAIWNTTKLDNWLKLCVVALNNKPVVWSNCISCVMSTLKRSHTQLVSEASGQKQQNRLNTNFICYSAHSSFMEWEWLTVMIIKQPCLQCYMPITACDINHAGTTIRCYVVYYIVAHGSVGSI